MKAPAVEAERAGTAPSTVGRKRRIVVDADGRPLMVNLTPADISEIAGAKAARRASRAKWSSMKTPFADSGYDRAGPMGEAAMLEFTGEVVRKIEGQSDFRVLARRSEVERAFAWMTPWGRLVRDYEGRIDVSEA